MRPSPTPDGHDFPGLVDEVVPGVAAEGDDLVVGCEDAVGQPVVAQELPDVLDWVEFWGARRQRQKGDVGRDRELLCGVPSCPVEDEYGVSAWADLGGNFVEVALHGGGVAPGQNQSGAHPAFRTNGAEDVGRLGSLIVRRTRSAAASGPAAGKLVFLAYPGLVLPPQFYPRAVRKLGADFVQQGRETFLKSSTAFSF